MGDGAGEESAFPKRCSAMPSRQDVELHHVPEFWISIAIPQEGLRANLTHVIPNP
jgi:hypothetical protein